MDYVTPLRMRTTLPGVAPCDHVKTRISKCKRSITMYSLNTILYQTSLSKVHLYKTTCHPTLNYGMDSLNSNSKCIKQLVNTRMYVV